MSFFRSSFSLKRPKPRKVISSSPLQLTAEQQNREIGPVSSAIQVNLGSQNIEYNPENGVWNMGKIWLKKLVEFINDLISCLAMNLEEIENAGAMPKDKNRRKVEKEIHVLKEENNMLRLKVEILLNLVAESIAELRNGK